MTLHVTAPPAPEGSGIALFLRRLWGLALRHIYVHTSSWPRIIEMLYWPLINMATWAFASSYFVKKFSDAEIVAGILVASVILVEVLVRIITTLLMLFLEEIWSRNLGHMFASPIKFFEYTLGIIAVCLVRTVISLTPAVLIAYWMFDFSILSLGWPMLSYILLLVLNGCWMGILILALLLRYGLAAEWMAWMCTWLLIPFIAPYYPVDILPHSIQFISWSIPATYVFESVKSQMGGTGWLSDYLLISLGLNVFYIIMASFIFYRAYRGARQRGGLLQVGE